MIPKDPWFVEVLQCILGIILPVFLMIAAGYGYTRLRG